VSEYDRDNNRHARLTLLRAKIQATGELKSTPPTLSANFDGILINENTYSGAIDITLNATDASNSGSIERLVYTLDEGEEIPYTETFTVLESGTHNIAVTAEDGYGNISTENYDFIIQSSETGAVIYVENMNKIPTTNRGFPADNYYSFNRLKNTLANEGIPTHDSSIMRLNNTGTGDLIISEINISDTTKFTYQIIAKDNEPVTLPLTVSPGEYRDLNISFIGEILNGVGNARALYKETITIISNSENDLENTSTLHGAFASKTEGNNEISAQEILDVLGFKTSMLSLVNEEGTITPQNKNPSRPSSNYPTAANTDAGYEGDMIISPTFVQADSSKPVTAMQVMALHGPETGIGKFVEPNSGNVVGGISFRHDKTQYQTLFPLGNNGSELVSYSMSKSIVNPFRIAVANAYATGGGSDLYGSNPNLLGVRVYKVIDQDGFIVPNEYIAIQDYIGEGCDVAGQGNCDFNDNVFYFTNIRPEAVPQTGEIQPYTAYVNTAFSYDLSIYFDKGYAGNKLIYSALSQGLNLPEWLNLNYNTGVISGIPPAGAQNTYNIDIKAADLNGIEVSSSFELSILNAANTRSLNDLSSSELKIYDFEPSSITMYPNPATSSVNIVTGNLASVISKFVLSDVRGIKIKEFNASQIKSGQSYVLPLYNIQAGIYFVNVVSDGFMKQLKL
ncbi:MAG: putative Ig domain-containing protein, partial [Leeuwenhoekiella sp.]